VSIFGREVSFWVGVVVALVLGVVQTLSGNGLISDALTGQITDGVDAISQAILLLVPVITGLIIRQGVTPVNAPALPQGTVVEVITPDGQANTHTAL
jgi:hypothetical protein